MKRVHNESHNGNEQTGIMDTLPMEELWVRIFGFLPLYFRYWVVPAVNTQWRTIVEKHQQLDQPDPSDFSLTVRNSRYGFTVDDWKPAKTCRLPGDDEQIRSLDPPYPPLLPLFILLEGVPLSLGPLLQYSIEIDSETLLYWSHDMLFKMVANEMAMNKRGGSFYITQTTNRCLISACELKRWKLFHWLVCRTAALSNEPPMESEFEIPMREVFRTRDLKWIQFATTWELDNKKDAPCWPRTIFYEAVETHDKEIISWVLAASYQYWEPNYKPHTNDFPLPPDRTTMWVSTIRPRDGVVDFELLKWADSMNYPWRSPHIIDAAVGLGRFDIVEWALEKDCPLCPESVLLQVAKYGQMEALNRLGFLHYGFGQFIQWAREPLIIFTDVIPAIKTITSSIDGDGVQRILVMAVLRGHVEVVKWIRLQYGHPILVEMYRLVCQSGSVAMFDYLVGELTNPHHSWYEPIGKRWINAAICARQKDILNCIRKEMGPTREKEFISLALRKAVAERQPCIVHWIQKTFPLGGHPKNYFDPSFNLSDSTDIAWLSEHALPTSQAIN